MVDKDRNEQDKEKETQHQQERENLDDKKQETQHKEKDGDTWETKKTDGWNTYDYSKLSAKQNLLMTFLISFVTGLITASIVLAIYVSYVRHPVRFYSFNLARVVDEMKNNIMHSKKSSKEIKKEINSYMTAVGEYVNSFSKKGIVFVGGATIGKSPYVKDITKGFEKTLKDRTNSEQE